MSIEGFVEREYPDGFISKLSTFRGSETPNVVNLPHMIYKYHNALHEGITVAEIPTGSILYKPVSIPSELLSNVDFLPQQDVTRVLQTILNSTSWFSTYSKAKAFVDSPQGRQGNYRLAEFKVIRPLKLFNLSIYDNIRYILHDIDMKLHNIRSRPKVKDYLMARYNELLIRREIVQLATGFDVTYAEQMELVKKWGKFFSDDANYDPEVELAKRKKKWPSHSSVNEIYFTSRDGKPSVVNFLGTFYGPGMRHLNRISFTTELDRCLAETIGMFFNVDGYYSPQVPSLFHRDGNLPEEIAILIPRSALVPLQLNTRIQTVPVFQYGGKRPSKAASVTLKRKKSIVKGSTIQFTPFSFRKITTRSSATGLPAKRRKVVKRKRRT